jgi:signal transduction histidine kinase
VDAVLVVLVVGQLVELAATRSSTAGVAVVVLMVLAPSAMLLRHRVSLAAVVVSFGSFAALIQLVPASLSTTFLALLFVVGVSGALQRVAAGAGLLGALAVGFEGAWLDRYGGGVGDFAMSAAIMAGVWVCGMLVARTTRAAARSAARLEQVERARADAARDAVRAERHRLTRELHDAVAHGLTVLVVQTVAAQEDLQHGESPAGLARRLRATEEVARESLIELRTLLGILGAGEDGPPSTGLSGIQALVERLSTPEFPVSLRVVDVPPHWGRSVELATYRAVQEGLTNALKHGDGRGADVVLSGGDGVLHVEVSNGVAPGAARRVPVSGHGLPGLQERLDQLGSHLEVHQEDGRFRLCCSLQLTHASLPVGA